MYKMSEQGKKNISNRIRSWKAKCVTNGFSYKEVIEEANLNYDSVINAMGSALNGNPKAISSERLKKLEVTLGILVLKQTLSEN